MAPVPVSVLRKCSLSDVQRADGHGPAPAEYSNRDYVREVLQLQRQLGNDQAEALVDETLVQEAETWGIAITTTVPGPATSKGGQDQNAADNSNPPSKSTVALHHTRCPSSGSHETNSTVGTSRSSREQADNPARPQFRRRSSSKKTLSFSDYEKYLAEVRAQDNTQVEYVAPPAPKDPAPTLFSLSTRKSHAGIKKRLKRSFSVRRRSSTQDDINFCICCRDEFGKNSKELHTLPCGHSYCDTCLRVITTQAVTDESKMPPRCCSQPVPSTIIKTVLTKGEQYSFMKSVLQFSTPWEARIFCPNTACGEFVPGRSRVDPKHPFEVMCRKCRTKACSTCKRAAHAFGQDCPADWELDAVLQMGEKSGWRRCYKCRTLVELTQGCSHITCRCKAQFCYICGAVWNPVVGCPNYCSGEEELERRRLEEEARMAELAKEKAEMEEAERIEAAEKVAAEERTRRSSELNALRAQQINEHDRFIAFERKMKWMMWTRHGQLKLDILDRYGEMLSKMKERHIRTATHLEDRQVGAELELRASHKQAERSVQIRLRHMEAYCDGLGRNASGSNPARVVTERDLRELGQQYSVRDDLERLHQSKINVMRDKQSKQMEELLARQEDELDKLATKQAEELEGLEERFVNEEDGLADLFQQRRARLRWRWGITEEILRKQLEAREKVKFAMMKPVEWPELESNQDDGLEAVSE
ncbi:Uncharacterized protein BP5553_09704 [Venustampulla echinocandica]|uniref:RBR-type E3 ubiquitin transferase n=1 Tax=Venustampulla echinocandica TaxID=2656787 RepID=A0A370TBS9_9HELO|nr:Uncharacterized protein BP5553_09704 [Venustampulla echinocandica]RDL31495.1 Uncharacterized protein BP5553_09704 [Venustampulla echinocandica]